MYVWVYVQRTFSLFEFCHASMNNQNLGGPYVLPQDIAGFLRNQVKRALLLRDKIGGG